MQKPPIRKSTSPPADPHFVEALRLGFNAQQLEFEQSLAIMRELSVKRELAIAAGDPDPRFVNSQTKEEFHYIDPDYMQAAQENLQQQKEAILKNLGEAHSCAEQRSVLLDTLRSMYYAHLYVAAPALTMQNMEMVIEHAQVMYKHSNTPRTPEEAQAREEGLVAPINRGAKEYWRTAINDIHEYVDLCIDAADDLRDLVTAYQESHQIPESVGTVGELASQRYKRVIGIDSDAPSFTLQYPKKYSEIMVNLLRNDLYGPYTDMTRGHMAPELAWFIGRSMEQVHKEDSTRSASLDVPDLSVIDAISPEGRLPALYARLLEKHVPPQAEGMDQIDMMRDRGMQIRAMGKMKPVFEKHPLGTSGDISIDTLLNAKRAFKERYKIQTRTDLPDFPGGGA